MIGQKLHQYDVALCQYALNNVRGYMNKPAFATFVEDQLDPLVVAHMKALSGDTDSEPPSLLLNDQEFRDIAATFQGGPLEHDRAWCAHEPTHRGSICCAHEIHAHLGGAYADEWARASAVYAKHLEADTTHLGDGIETVGEWVREVRRLLLALGATALLPRPERSFPTPNHLEPSPPDDGQEARTAQKGQESGNDLLTAIARTEALQLEVRDLLVSQRAVRDYYSTADAATILNKSEFTVREWCRLGQCRAEKQKTYRGGRKQWMVPHDELTRLQNEGPAPLGTYRLPSAEH